jgi:hypothetical protein
MNSENVVVEQTENVVPPTEPTPLPNRGAILRCFRNDRGTIVLKQRLGKRV